MRAIVFSAVCFCLFGLMIQDANGGLLDRVRRRRSATSEQKAAASNTVQSALSGKSAVNRRGATVTRNADGTTTIQKQGPVTLQSGKTVDGGIETTVTRTEDGRSWTTEATGTGERGTATVTGAGQSTRSDDGVSWDVDRKAGGAGGRQAGSASTGSAADGAWSSDTAGETEKGKTWNKDRDGSGRRQ
jgi:hypothetical protein